MNEDITPDYLRKYIELSESFYALEKDRLNIRIGTHAILDFYKILLSKTGENIGERNCESQAIPNKFFSIRMHIPEFVKHEALVIKVEETRNKISHNDLWFSAKDLNYLIDQSEDFLIFSISEIQNHAQTGEKLKTLKDKVAGEIYNMGFYITLNEGVGYSEMLSEFKLRKAGYEVLDLESLKDRNLQIILGFLSIEVRQLKSIYDKAWDNCPKCGGKIVQKTDSTTHYSGPYDDPEPCAVTYSETVECEKCGFKLVDEQHTEDI